MAVDFTPTMQEYSGQGKFRYWVQMVLPTIYDDSLSYMELLNKVVYVINLAIEDVGAVEENVAALLTAFEQLQQYTNDYFDNLDVQQEINNKLDQMVEDGTLTEIVSPILDTLIPTKVTEWLDQHIEPTTPPIDNTLTVSGAGADAKVVGDIFKQVENVISIDGDKATVINETYFNLTKGDKLAEGEPTTTTNNYYRRVRRLDRNKKYNIKITLQNSGFYSFWCGTSGSVGSMIDLLANTYTETNTIFLTEYTPSFASEQTYDFFRCDVNSPWTIEFYECIDLFSRIANVENEFNLTLHLAQISVAEFSQEPYNNLLSNLPDNTFFRYGTAYQGLDLPFNRDENYFIITMTEGNKIQIAFTRWGEIFVRNYYSGSYKEWYPVGGTYKYETVITDNSIFTSYDQFPNGSIININKGVDLENAPSGFINIGHGTVDSGDYNIVVMTYSGRIQTTNNYRVQTAVLYDEDFTTTPKMATRFGKRITGTQNFAWSRWSEISEDSVLHASNKVVDINTYQQVTFSDFNDAPPNSIFQVDLNTGNTILNNPAPGRSGVLITYNYSPTNRHATVQNYYALEQGDFNMYFRYGYWASQGVFNFTRWKKVASEYVG